MIYEKTVTIPYRDWKTLNEVLEEIRKIEPRLEKYDEGEKSNNDPKKVIEEDELERYLAEGWDVQTVLPSGRILIKRAG